MNQCECVAGCPFFNDKMTAMPAMADIYKRNYCQGDSSSCARHEVFAAFGPNAVPADLYPNQKDRSAALIAASAY